MEFTVHEIGKHQFIETKGYVVALGKNKAKEVEIENLKANYERIKQQAENETEAFEEFVRVCGMRKREDWIGYQYDGDFTHLLEDQGFIATLPIKDALGGSVVLAIQYWKQDDELTVYQVFSKRGSWEGTIRNEDEEPKEFFERFIGEVCFHNGVLLEEEKYGNRLFPFASRSVQKQFNFSPGFAVINPVQDYIQTIINKEEVMN